MLLPQFYMLKLSPTLLILNAKMNWDKLRVWPKSSEAKVAMTINIFAGYFFTKLFYE